MTGKQRALRVPLTHHKRKDQLVRSRLTWTVVATIFAGGYFFMDMVPIKGLGEERYSHGPVATVHATWENECEACHIDFVPIRSDAWAVKEGWLASLLPAEAGDQPARASDKKCQSCHEGPVHHANEKSESSGSCASCHFEHLGRGFDIARTADKKCISCHSDLENHMDDKSIYPDSPIHNVITQFTVDHPEFRSIKSDPGRIKFPHSRHLTAGIKLGLDDRGEMKLSQLSTTDRKRYMKTGQSDGYAVQLVCSDCHKLDSVDRLKSVGNVHAGMTAPPRTGGEYMLPMSYENDCQACHPLSISPGSTQVVPHGLKPDELLAFIRNYYFQQELSSESKEDASYTPSRRVPGRNKMTPEELATMQIVDLKASVAEKHIRRVCNECHYFEKEQGTKLPSVQPASIPSIWYLHAKFDHTAHRAVNCEDCHTGVSSSKQHTDVLIPDYDLCAKCHSGRSPLGAGGGARSDCVECHRYHGGDHPLRGFGTNLRGAAKGRNLEEFLKGSGAE